MNVLWNSGWQVQFHNLVSKLFVFVQSTKSQNNLLLFVFFHAELLCSSGLLCRQDTVVWSWFKSLLRFPDSSLLFSCLWCIVQEPWYDVVGSKTMILHSGIPCCAFNPEMFLLSLSKNLLWNFFDKHVKNIL